MGEAQNEHVGLLRRRRFLCPKCTEHKMLIMKSGQILCANGCTVSPSQAKAAVKNRLYDGFFMTADLEALSVSIFPYVRKLDGVKIINPYIVKDNL